MATIATALSRDRGRCLIACDRARCERMSAQLWKRVGEEPSVTFRCPWCDVVGVSAVKGRHEQRDTIWLLAGCPNIPCGRGVLIQVPSREPWARLDTGDDGMLLGPSCVMPSSRQ